MMLGPAAVIYSCSPMEMRRDEDDDDDRFDTRLKHCTLLYSTLLYSSLLYSTMGAMAAVSTYLPVGVCRQLLQGSRVYDAELHLGQSDTNCTQPTFRPRLRPYSIYDHDSDRDSHNDASDDGLTR